MRKEGLENLTLTGKIEGKGRRGRQRKGRGRLLKTIRKKKLEL